MKELLLNMYFRIKEMPLFLLFIFIVSIGGIFFAVFSIFNINSYQINGQDVAYKEVWSSRLGLSMTITGLVLFISGIGIFRKKKWARITFLSTVFIPLALNHKAPPINEIIYEITAWFIVFGSYLYLKQSVKNYFL